MSWQDLKVETWRQKLKQKPRKNADYWLAPYGLLSLLSYRTQDHQPMGVPWAVLLHIYHQSGKCTTGLPTCQSIGNTLFSNWGSPAKWLWLGSSWHKISQRSSPSNDHSAFSLMDVNNDFLALWQTVGENIWHMETPAKVAPESASKWDWSQTTCQVLVAKTSNAFVCRNGLKTYRIFRL